VTYGYNFIGAQANINVRNPKVDKPEDFTTAQMWLKADNGNDFESIEQAGVQIIHHICSFTFLLFWFSSPFCLSPWHMSLIPYKLRECIVNS